MDEDRKLDLKVQDNLRAALLSLVHACLGDDYLELLDGSAPTPEEYLDQTVFLTEMDKRAGDGEKLDAAVKEFEAKLKALGLHGVLYVASKSALLDQVKEIRARLYGRNRNSLN